KVALACQTDAAYRLLCGGYSPSAATLKRFRAQHGEFFAHAIEQTVKLAHERGLLDADEIAVDGMRLRAHASSAAVRTLSRSSKRLQQLREQCTESMDEPAREAHAAKVQKHLDAVEACHERKQPSVVTTNELA